MNEKPIETEEEKQATLTMAKQLHSAAVIAWETNRAHCEFLGDDSVKPWLETTEQDRQTAIQAAARIVQHPEMTVEQNHALFCSSMKHEGWAHGDEYNAEAKTHPLLVPYEEIPEHERLKDVLFRAIIKTVMGFKPAGA